MNPDVERGNKEVSPKGTIAVVSGESQNEKNLLTRKSRLPKSISDSSAPAQLTHRCRAKVHCAELPTKSEIGNSEDARTNEI
jgi:hypothetical protein